MRSVKSVFQETAWREQRHMLNPSKLKEYELHASGLGFLNKINPFSDHREIFTHIDELNDEALSRIKKKANLLIVRETLSEEESNLLSSHGFKLEKTWGTLILDLSKPFELDKVTQKNIRKGENRLKFAKVSSAKEFTDYYDLFKSSRKKLGLRTPRISAFDAVRSSPYYRVYYASDEEGKVVAGVGEIANQNYMREVQAGRDSSCFFANDYLKFQILKEAQKEGIRWYDFSGCNPSPEPESKDEAIRKHKEKWGGVFYKEYTFRRR